MAGFEKGRIYALSPRLQEVCAIVRLRFEGKSTIFQQDDFRIIALIFCCMYLSRNSVLCLEEMTDEKFVIGSLFFELFHFFNYYRLGDIALR